VFRDVVPIEIAGAPIGNDLRFPRWVCLKWDCSLASPPRKADDAEVMLRRRKRRCMIAGLASEVTLESKKA
jgi:hypothetical protein